MISPANAVALIRAHSPVECNGVRYKCIRALIYRAVINPHSGLYKMIYQAELECEKANSVVICPLDKVKEIGK